MRGFSWWKYRELAADTARITFAAVKALVMEVSSLTHRRAQLTSLLGAMRLEWRHPVPQVVQAFAGWLNT